MKISRTISTVEIHAGGEAFRIVTGGLPRLPDDTIVERRAWLKENADDILKVLMVRTARPCRYVRWLPDGTG